MSPDSGASWQSLQLNLPVTPIHDLLIKDGDLVAGTHGRSFWILDDLTPLRQFTKEALEDQAHLFEPRPTLRALDMLGKTDPVRIGPGKNYLVALGAAATFEEVETLDGGTERVFLDAGHNPPDGAVNHLPPAGAGGGRRVAHVSSTRRGARLGGTADCRRRPA